MYYNTEDQASRNELKRQNITKLDTYRHYLFTKSSSDVVGFNVVIIMKDARERVKQRMDTWSAKSRMAGNVGKKRSSSPLTLKGISSPEIGSDFLKSFNFKAILNQNYIWLNRQRAKKGIQVALFQFIWHLIRAPKSYFSYFFPWLLKSMSTFQKQDE